MQEYTPSRSVRTVAPDSSYKYQRLSLICCGIVIAAVIEFLLLPEWLRDALFPLTQTPPWFDTTRPAWYGIMYFFLSPLTAYFFFSPFITVRNGIRRWKRFDQARQQAVKNYLSGRETVTFPLPEITVSLPATVSLQLRRNWRVTRIAGVIYGLPIAIFLYVYTSFWQVNMVYLAQRGELSALALPGTIISLLLLSLFCFPAIHGFLFAPRQQIIGTQDGLICRRGLHFSYIPWEEALLFAVVAESEGTFIYELASDTQIIRWSSTIVKNYGRVLPAGIVGIAPLGLAQASSTSEDYQSKARLLVSIVAARTRLPLADLRSAADS